MREDPQESSSHSIQHGQKVSGHGSKDGVHLVLTVLSSQLPKHRHHRNTWHRQDVSRLATSLLVVPFVVVIIV